VNPERWALVFIVVGFGMLAVDIGADLLTGWHPNVLGMMGFVVAMSGAGIQQRAKRSKALADPGPPGDAG
jgi:hypothetical protein